MRTYRMPCLGKFQIFTKHTLATLRHNFRCHPLAPEYKQTAGIKKLRFAMNLWFCER